MCCVSHVYMSLVTCYLLLVTLTATATDPPAAKSPIMHSKLVCKWPKTPKKSLTRQKSLKLKKFWNYASISYRLVDHKSPVHPKLGFPVGTDTQTHDSRALQLRDWANLEKQT